MATQTITRDSSPTPRQLAYLRGLAERAGKTYRVPKDRAQANRAIKACLKALNAQSTDIDENTPEAAGTEAPAPEPTAKQMRTLRNLASRLGETFSMPATSQEASREIKRMIARDRALTSQDRDEMRAGDQFWNDSWSEERDDLYAVGVRFEDDEIVGYGADARFA